MIQHTNLENAVDVGAVATLAAVLFGALPHATAVLTFIWVLIRLSETATVRLALKRLRRWFYG